MIRWELDKIREGIQGLRNMMTEPDEFVIIEELEAKTEEAERVFNRTKDLDTE